MCLIISAVVTYFHWIGLILAGITSAYFSRDLKRAITTGFLFGVVIVTLFMVKMAYSGQLKFINMGALFYLSIAVGLILPTFTSAIKGLMD
jgi:hypothetical protein